VVASPGVEAAVYRDGACYLGVEDVTGDAEILVALLEGLLAGGVGGVEVVRVHHSGMDIWDGYN